MLDKDTPVRWGTHGRRHSRAYGVSRTVDRSGGLDDDEEYAAATWPALLRGVRLESGRRVFSLLVGVARIQWLSLSGTDGAKQSKTPRYEEVGFEVRSTRVKARALPRGVASVSAVIFSEPLPAHRRHRCHPLIERARFEGRARCPNARGGWLRCHAGEKGTALLRASCCVSLSEGAGSMGGVRGPHGLPAPTPSQSSWCRDG
jgi:hypothetical protein